MLQIRHGNWQDWIAYFEYNASNLMPIDWHPSIELDAAEIQRVKKSIQQFQLGESSDGSHVLAQAKRYIAASGDPCYLAALRLFMQEEHRHSSYLAHFLHEYGILLVKKHPVDSVFRFLRHRFNLEFSVMAMLSAEIIAIPYYQALHDATHSPLLRQICRQVLRDEIQHLKFQWDTLAAIRGNHSPLNKALIQGVHRVLLMGAICIVWQQHHAVLVAGNYSFAKLWRTCWLHFGHQLPKAKTHYSETHRS